MKIKCRKQELMNSLNIVSKAVSAKTSMPILECILIEVYESSIRLTANNLELGIETGLNGEVIEMGRIALESKIFMDIVRKLPDSEVFIETTPDYKAIIRCEKTKFVIAAKSGEDFTDLPQIEREKNITISQFTLRELIRQTIFCISDNENNRMMTGELFEVSGNKLKVSALDGFRISIRNVELKKEGPDVRVIVPGKTLTELSKIINGGVDDEVVIYFTKQHVLFEYDDTLVVSRLIDGDFFDVNKMMSVTHNTKITCNTKEYLDCLDRATLVIKESDKKPIVMIVREEGVMYIKADSMLGSLNEEIAINKEGEDLIIGFNPRFIMDCIRVIDDEDIKLYMKDGRSPAFIKDDNETYIYIVSPININTDAY